MKTLFTVALLCSLLSLGLSCHKKTRATAPASTGIEDTHKTPQPPAPAPAPAPAPPVASTPPPSPIIIPPPKPVPVPIIKPNLPAKGPVIYLILENTSYEKVFGNKAMPYLNSLVAKGALAQNYYSNTHNSLTALDWLIAGQGVTKNDNNTLCFKTDNIMTQLKKQGLTFKSYQEDLPSPGFLGLAAGGSNGYVRRHNPLINFQEMCGDKTVAAATDVDLGFLTNDLTQKLADFVYITPNLANDMHNGTPGQAESWLKVYIPKILASPSFGPQGHGILMITFDEGGLGSDNAFSLTQKTGGGGHVFTLFLGPAAKAGAVSKVVYHHENFLATACYLLGIKACPGAAAKASPMKDMIK